MDVIWVRSGGTPGDAVALWERAPEHPDGEVFVAGPAPVRVAVTPAVIARLRDGRLVLDMPGTPAPDAPHEPAAGANSAAARGDHPDTVAAKPATPPRRGRGR